jgi:hypothetical protein
VRQAETLAEQLEPLGRASTASRLRELAGSLVGPSFRIVVFGEFNQGKSTLINALLGSDALPMSVLPTTALLTEVRYGEEAAAVVRVGGTDRRLASMEELADFATLDLGRQARGDVEAVTLTYPSPLCRHGVLLYDTPGLNDRAEQDEAATRALDLADLVLFVVDIRRLGTLNERTVLEHWLRARGLDAVIVAANFVNLVPPGEFIDLRERLAAFAQRWGCPYLPENCFEVDALGGLRARLFEEERGWERSGMGRLAATLERSVTENRQLLRRRSRLGRLRAFLREEAGAIRSSAETTRAAAAAADRRAGELDRALTRALRHVDAALQDLRDGMVRRRSELLAELRALLELRRDELPDLSATCSTHVSEFLCRAQKTLQAALTLAAGELPPGLPLSVKVRTRWPVELPPPVFERESEQAWSLPRDREQAATAARQAAEKGRHAAGKAAAGLHRGIGSLLDRAAGAPDPNSAPGRLLRQAHGAWSGIRPPPPVGPSTPSPPPERMTVTSRDLIAAALEFELREVEAYLGRLGENARLALKRRAKRALGEMGASQARASAAAWNGAEKDLAALLAALDRELP